MRLQVLDRMGSEASATMAARARPAGAGHHPGRIAGTAGERLSGDQAQRPAVTEATTILTRGGHPVAGYFGGITRCGMTFCPDASVRWLRWRSFLVAAGLQNTVLWCSANFWQENPSPRVSRRQVDALWESGWISWVLHPATRRRASSPSATRRPPEGETRSAARSAQLGRPF